jgi:hypothetical protein
MARRDKQQAISPLSLARAKTRTIPMPDDLLWCINKQARRVNFFFSSSIQPFYGA